MGGASLEREGSPLANSITEEAPLGLPGGAFGLPGDPWFARESHLTFWGPHWPKRAPLGLTEGIPLTCEGPPWSERGSP